jgi:hypothetical protein
MPNHDRVAIVGQVSGASPSVELEVGEHTVRVSNPHRVYFPAIVHQKRVPAGAPEWIPTVRVYFPVFDLDHLIEWADRDTVDLDDTPDTAGHP